MFDKLKPKNKTSILVTIILCLPILLIGILFIKYYNHNNATSSISDIYISIPDGETVNLSGDNLKLYTELYYNCTEVESLPSDAVKDQALTIMYVIKDITTHYDLFFTKDLDHSYLVSENGDIYLIDDQHTKLLSLRPECNYIYPNNSLPSLTIKKGDLKSLVFPISYNWKFKKTDGNFYNDSSQDIQENDPEKVIIHASDSNTFEFSTTPDSISVVYYDELGNVIKNSNTIDEIKLDSNSDVNFSVFIDAKWSSVEGAEGNSKYLIKFLYDMPEKFTLVQDRINPGDILIIKADQFDLKEELNIESDLKFLNLKFVKYNGETFALVPIDSRNVAKDYFINLTVNGNTTELTFTVDHIDFGVDFYNPEKILSDTANEDLELLYSEINTTNESVKHFKAETSFCAPLSGEVFFNFGKEIFSSSGPASYFCQGTEYTVKAGTKVKSTETGVVCYVGENERLGKLVVIDHGLGVKSYYAHLDDIYVEVGTLVQKNITIATSGNSGYTINDMFYFAISVNGTFVDPTIVLTEGIKLP